MARNKRNNAGSLDVRFEMRLDKDLAERLQAQADRLGLSMGSYMRQSLVRQLEQDELEADRNRTSEDRQ